MGVSSAAGYMIPKLVCLIAVCALVAFFLLNRRREPTKYAEPIATTDYSSQLLDQTDRPNQVAADKDSSVDNEFLSDIDSLPFSISNPMPSEDTNEDGFHLYNFNVPLETGSIVDMYLKEPEGGDMGLGVFNEDGDLAYSNDTENGGSESIRFVVKDKKPLTAAVETIEAPQTGQSGYYTLLVTSDPEERGYHIESLPFAMSRSIRGQEKLHLYQTTFPVDSGTIVGAKLKSSDNAGLALYISDEEGTINYSTSRSKDEKEAALTFFKGGRATIVIEVQGEGNEHGPYTLSVKSKGTERLIETLPYTATGSMSQADAEGKNWHWYKIADTVPAGSVISANLSVTGKANMDVTIFVDRDTISYGASNGIGENEYSELTIKEDSSVYVIVDNVEGEGEYTLVVTNSVPSKP